jgi:hypothetical protein
MNFCFWATPSTSRMPTLGWQRLVCRSICHRTSAEGADQCRKSVSDCFYEDLFVKPFIAASMGGTSWAPHEGA